VGLLEWRVGGRRSLGGCQLWRRFDLCDRLNSRLRGCGWHEHHRLAGLVVRNERRRGVGRLVAMNLRVGWRMPRPV
jgi:hypothetical protein